MRIPVMIRAAHRGRLVYRSVRVAGCAVWLEESGLKPRGAPIQGLAMPETQPENLAAAMVDGSAAPLRWEDGAHTR
jgi:hypothetical protein